MRRDGIRASGRRRWPRIEVDGPFQVVDLTLQAAMDVLDVSVGGFRGVSPFPIVPGTRHTIRVALPDRAPLPLVAEAVYCFGAAAGFTVGWKWGSDSATGRGIVALLEHLSDARTYRPPVTMLSMINAKA